MRLSQLATRGEAPVIARFMVLAGRLMLAVVIGMIVAMVVPLVTRGMICMLDCPAASIPMEDMCKPRLVLAQLNCPSCWKGYQEGHADNQRFH